MELNEKMIEEIAQQLGISDGGKIGKDTINRLAQKNEADLEKELRNIKATLKAKNITYDKQVAILKQLAPMMNQKQRERLEKVVEILNK
jgi:hypothetical protein